MINVQKKHITAGQLGILFWALGLVLLTTLFYTLLYQPMVERMLDKRDEVNQIEDHLRWITQTIDSLGDPKHVFEYFVTQNQALVRRFPDSAERSLLALADYANKFHVRISQVHADEPRKVFGDRGRRLGADGKKCLGVRVTLKFLSEYHNLVKYIETLRKALPAPLVIERMEIDNGFTSTPKLSGSIELFLYLLE
jgi:hypothetical protein